MRGGALVALAITLARLLLAAGAEAVVHHERFEAAPSGVVRDSLAAMARSGERVSWSGPVSTIAAMAEAVREPRPAVRVSVVADSFAVIADTLGALDSLGAGGGTVTVAAGVEDAALAMHATERGTRARVAVVSADEPRRILVIGRAGWEAKFVVAALEESGWRVDARLRLSDSMSIAQGISRSSIPMLATHSAVVVLDTAVGAQGAAITRFVRAGGGLVLSGDAVRAPAFAAIAPARARRLLGPLVRGFEERDPLDALALNPLTPRSDAIALESRGAAATIVARREGAGRAVQTGFADTWRWRMEGGPGSVAAHREWWSRLVALAVPTPAPTTRTSATDEGAPLAALTAALGSPVEAPSRSGPRAPVLPLWVGTLVLVALLAEWALRRTRGVA
jgi:hypothetical protein